MSNKKNRNFMSEEKANDESMATDPVDSVSEESSEVKDPIIDEVPQEDVPIEEVHGIVTCTRLNLRKDPFVEIGNVVDTLLKGTEVVIEPSTLNDTWCKVYTSVGLSGYCMRDYISVVK